MRKFNKFFSFIFLAVLLVIAGCSQKNSASNTQSSTNPQKNQGSGEPKQGGDLVFGYDTDISNFDPILGNSGNDHAMLYPIYDTLVNYNSNLEPEPGLAESWETPDDKTIVLHLRKGVTFHDGTEFNAEAVKFNLERVNAEGSNVSDIKNVESVEAVDPYTVKLTLKQPDSSIILALSDRSGMMVSPTAVQKLGKDFAQNPVGAGPFKFVKWIPNGEIQYAKNEKYWQKGLPYLNTITAKIMPDENTRLNALKSGQLNFYWNVSINNVQVLEKDPNVVLDSKMRVFVHNIYLNTKLAPFDKKEVRQAFQYAIDRQAIIKALYFGKGEPASQAFPKDYWAYNPDLKLEYNPKKSKELLKSVGLDRVSFDLMVPTVPEWQRMGEAIKGQAKEAGIDINIQTMEMNKGNALYFNEKQIPANLTAWTGRPDPQQTVNLFLSGSGFYNTGGATTPEKEELIAKAAGSYDIKVRAQLYGRINEIAMVEEAMTIPLVFTPVTGAMKPEVKGFEGTLLGKPKVSFLWIDK
ncbi:hypothetical protein BABA_03819 [Neobacillus bataviensis LMG 21833]|uniref:Solute-binding protein family 5 domain-containing protein n=1 Tax=Neobacillus bataviensis LMG 21833 TaxID=1117379 RepID=K6DEI1_9BACI|nr:ABC transporter substrate-binding protein [Neobacillus bataviensis]EKN70957.1 hypothetical protein BABA_03819 [Neobacillus bataviensis LMG 21833]